MPGLGSAVIAAWNRRSGSPSAAGGRGTRGLCSKRKFGSSRRNLRRAREAKTLKKLRRALAAATAEFLQLSRREAEQFGISRGWKAQEWQPSEHEPAFDLPTEWLTPANSDGGQGHDPTAIVSAMDPPLNSAQSSSGDSNDVDAVAPPPAEPPIGCHEVLEDFVDFIRANQASPRLIAFLRQHAREWGNKRESTRIMLLKDDQRRLALWLSLRGQAAEDLARISQQGAMPKDQAQACLKWLTRTNARIRRRLNAI